jgi:ABC-type glycerol-3-phosphate transport system substrate-binding protein
VVNRPIATLAVALGLLAACGGSGGTGDEATVDVAAPATATTAHIPATDSVQKFGDRTGAAQFVIEAESDGFTVEGYQDLVWVQIGRTITGSLSIVNTRI